MLARMEACVWTWHARLVALGLEREARAVCQKLCVDMFASLCVDMCVDMHLYIHMCFGMCVAQ